MKNLIFCAVHIPQTTKYFPRICFKMLLNWLERNFVKLLSLYTSKINKSKKTNIMCITRFRFWYFAHILVHKKTSLYNDTHEGTLPAPLSIH